MSDFNIDDYEDDDTKVLEIDLTDIPEAPAAGGAGGGKIVLATNGEPCDEAVEWCDEHLPEIYNPGMFDYEEIAEEVWATMSSLAQETVLQFLDDDEEYEQMNEQLHDAAKEWFEAHHDLVIEAITATSPKALMERPQTSQHSADWYAQRRNRLTASEFAQILDGRRGALLRSKVAPVPEGAAADRPSAAPVSIAQTDGEMVATSWGHRFEPVTRAIYEQELAGVGTVCDTLGRFQHPIVEWLSASPDGVVLEGPLAGRLVEIKSPKTRKPGEFVPPEYYIQMQIQMEVCDTDAVDFVEAQFAQRPVFHLPSVSYAAAAGAMEIEASTDPKLAVLDPADAAAVAAARWKGRIRVFGRLDDQSTWCYRYSPPVEDLEDAVVPDGPADLPLLEESVWWLTGWFPRTVLRNRSWWEETGWPAAQMFWAEVQSLRDLDGSGGAGASAYGGAGRASDDVISHVGWAGRN
jgi:hypothetical protein